MKHLCFLLGIMSGSQSIIGQINRYDIAQALKDNYCFFEILS